MRPDRSPRVPIRRAVPAAVLGLGAALALTACGASGEDASGAWDRARAQLEGAQSVRMTTEVSTDAGVAGGGMGVPDATEVAGAVDGGDLLYTGEFRAGQHTARDETRVVGGKQYHRFAVEERGGVAGPERPEYAQKWQEAPAAQGLSMRAVVDGLLAGVPAAGGLEGAAVEADGLRRSGEDAVRYVLEQPAAGAGDGTTRLKAFTVAEDDGALLTVETVAPGTEGTVTFSDWDAVEPVEVPAADEIAAPPAAPEPAPAG